MRITADRLQFALCREQYAGKQASGWQGWHEDLQELSIATPCEFTLPLGGDGHGPHWSGQAASKHYGLVAAALKLHSLTGGTLGRDQ